MSERYEDDRAGRDEEVREERAPPPPPRRERSYSRSRSPPAVRQRSRSPRRDRSRSPPRRTSNRMETEGDSYRRDTRDRAPYDSNRRAHNREYISDQVAKKSQKDCRVYVGNLSFGVKWNDLKDFMREAGHVVFAEVMMLPNGMSKGCGIVEFSRPEEAQKAIRDLTDQTLLGRPLFIREDREEEAKFGAAAVSSRGGRDDRGASSYPPPRGGYSGGRGGALAGAYGGHHGAAAAGGAGNKNLFVQGLPFSAGWQDLKDLFRAAGSVVRADVKLGPDGNPSGAGTVSFETAADAQTAIDMYHGFEYKGTVLSVREDRFAGSGSRGGFGGRGGYAGAASSRGGYGAPAPHVPHGFQPYNNNGAPLPPTTQIYVRNLPWSTADEDLVELFQTTGTVKEAEMLFQDGRSKGSGIVQFATVEEAEIAINKFSGYSYGGRPLQIEFNARWKHFGGGNNPPEGAPTGPAADSIPMEMQQE